MSSTSPDRQAGFTLVEVMISLALFGLIALAGFTLLDSELKVQARTDGRLERMGDLQRAMYVMTGDFEQLSGAVAGGGDAISFRRYATPGEVQVGYALRGETLERTLGSGVQRLVTGVTAVHMTFYVEGSGWQDAWPTGDGGAPRPSAVAIDITLKGPPGEGGVLRRLVALPATAS